MQAYPAVATKPPLANATGLVVKDWKKKHLTASTLPQLSHVNKKGQTFVHKEK
jgi:hypothetical protein